jgi:hypothetical protein
MSKGGDYTNLNQKFDFDYDQSWTEISKNKFVDIITTISMMVPTLSLDLFFALIFVLAIYLILTIRRNLKAKRLKNIEKIIKKNK